MSDYISIDVPCKIEFRKIAAEVVDDCAEGALLQALADRLLLAAKSMDGHLTKEEANDIRIRAKLLQDCAESLK